MAFFTMEGTCLSAGQRDCRRCVRGEGAVVNERASRSRVVGFISPSMKPDSEEVDAVGETEGLRSF